MPATIYQKDPMRQFITCVFAFALGIFAIGCSSQEKPFPTPIATTIPIPGWHILNGNKVNIWLPKSFDGGNPKTDAQQIISRLHELGPNFNQIAQVLQSNQGVIDLLAYDTEANDVGLVTNVVVNEESVPESIEINSYLNSLASHLPKQYEVLEQGIIPSEKYPTGRLVSVFNSPNGHIKQVLYVFKKSRSIWRLVFTTPESEYVQRTSSFDQSAISITIQDSGTSASSENNSSLIMLIGLTMMIGALVYRSWQNRKKANQNRY